MTDVIEFIVHGHAKTKGSRRNFISRTTGRVVSLNANPLTIHWQRAISIEAKQAFRGQQSIWTGAVRLDIDYGLKRPLHHLDSRGLVKPQYKDVRPAVKPDKDKLDRCVYDALEGVFFRNDSQVVSGGSEKWYPDQIGFLGARVRAWKI